MKKMLFMAAFALLAGVVVAQESRFMRVTQVDGTETDFAVSAIDSIYFVTKTSPSVTEPSVTDLNGHAYVDLGLPSGTLWATCNVGATQPEEYGDYFMWGFTTPSTNSECSWTTYATKFGSKENWGDDFTKYNDTDGKTTLDLADDAARANWGGSWRMPTKEEQQELNNNCTWTAKSLNGVNGYIVTGKNGNSIFLPAAGYRYSSDLYSAGECGRYWGSSLDSYGPTCAYYLYFDSGSHDWSSYGGSRYYGRSVRAVCSSR